ncbi:unnamed protein product [Effrenium voratum]|nr:unnamed protein product [Effrenium voratum]
MTLSRPSPSQLIGDPGADQVLSREGQEILRWAIPGLALLAGLFLEHAGLYLATRRYVQWMDELQRPGLELHIQLEGSANESLGSDLGFIALLLEILADLLPVLCLGLILCLGDLRLWCQTMFSAALLMTLKGFASWATVVPDARGWKACQERLGLDGLRYYREDLPMSKMVPDILLLEVRGLWVGSPLRQRLCADAPFCSSICLSTLFCTSLCEVSMTSWIASREDSGLLPAMAQCIRCLLLVLMLGTALVQGILTSRAEATALGMVLALAVRGLSSSRALGLSTGGGRLVPASLGAEIEILVARHEYCYLRKRPQESNLLQQQALLQQMVASMQKSQEALVRREQKKRELLKKEEADELLSAQRADRFSEQRIQEAVSDQQRMLHSRARKTRHVTVTFGKERHESARLLARCLPSRAPEISGPDSAQERNSEGLLLSSTMKPCKSEPSMQSPPKSLPQAEAWQLCGRLRFVTLGCALAAVHQRRQRAARASAGYGAGEVFSAPALTEDGEALVVWLHGLGDTGQGWSTTAPALQQMGLPMLHFLFPTAPTRGVGSKGMKPSWYDVPTLDPDQIARQPPPEGLLDGVDYVLDLIEPHVRRGIPPQRVFLAGYSQGGGLALAAALRAPRKLGGVLMLSSWVAEPLPSEFKEVPVHIFHGAEDPVVPLRTAQLCRGQLETAGLRTTFRAYPGMTHGVCDEEVAHLAQTFYESLSGV